MMLSSTKLLASLLISCAAIVAIISGGYHHSSSVASMVADAAPMAAGSTVERKYNEGGPLGVAPKRPPSELDLEENERALRNLVKALTWSAVSEQVDALTMRATEIPRESNGHGGHSANANWLLLFGLVPLQLVVMASAVAPFGQQRAASHR